MIKSNNIYKGDNIELIKEIEDESIHLILSDIPYGINFDKWDVLHDNKNSALGGACPSQLKMGNGFKSRGKPINGWSEADRKIPMEYQKWCEKWTEEWLRVLKPGSSCFIFAGRRFSHRVTVAMENAGFVLRDMIGWNRTNAMLKAQQISKVFERRGDDKSSEKFREWRVGNLRPVFEPILWFIKPYKQGGTIADNMLVNGTGAYNLEKWKKYVPNSGNYIEIPNLSSDRGSHPTQKPLELMKALIELVTQEGQVVLDPFAGSGTTLLAAKELGRKYIGFEMEDDFFENAIKRLENKN